MNYQEFPPGYAEGGFPQTPVFNPSFKIPVKVSQPPPPGTTDAEQEPEANQQPPLPPAPPQPDMTNVFQSPMFNYDPSYWAAQSGMTYQQPHYGMQMSQVTHPAVPEESRKRKLDIDYMGKDDPALPDELKKLFNALHCLLCDVKVNSPISAKMHYSSKTHEKKINQWLIEYCKRTGASMPKRQRKVTSIEEAQKAGPKGPNALFCDICQIALTSIQHANQHYMGKKHRMVATGKSKPKFQKPQVDNTGRFGIGQSFIQPLDEPGQTASLSISPPPTPVYDASTPGDAFTQSSPPQPTFATPKPGTIGPSLLPVMPPITAEKTKNPSNGKNPARYCEICDISVTSDQQMETHISGQKHQKKCKQIGITTELNPRSRSDFSSCRTPSGQYYCISCDLTVATEALYSSHIQSQHLQRQQKKKIYRVSKEGWISNGIVRKKPKILIAEGKLDSVVKSMEAKEEFSHIKPEIKSKRVEESSQNDAKEPISITLEVAKIQPVKNKRKQAKILENLNQKRMKMMEELQFQIKTEPLDENSSIEMPKDDDEINQESIDTDFPIVNVPVEVFSFNGFRENDESEQILPGFLENSFNYVKIKEEDVSLEIEFSENFIKQEPFFF